MALFGKLNQMAKNLGDRTSDVIETTKLNSKLAAERLAANEELLKIGQFYYDRFLAGQAEEGILEFCQNAKMRLDAADQLQAEIDRIKSDNGTPAAAPVAPAAPASGVMYCPNCGNQLAVGTKFCNQCGNRLEG